MADFEVGQSTVRGGDTLRGGTPTLPSVTAVSPNTGAASTAVAITITGIRFTGATGVTLGGTACTSVVVVNDTSITCTTPSKTAGTYDLIVTNAAGASAAVAADHFVISGGGGGGAPTVTNLSPTKGYQGGGTHVTITGTGYSGVTAVKFGTTDATSYTVNSPTSISAVAPSHAAGTVDVKVTNGSGTSGVVAGDAYLYTTTPDLAFYQIDIENSSVPTGNTYPTLKVEVAFDSDPLDNVPQWTDLSNLCRKVEIHRGRSFELDDTQAGTATFTFNNLARVLDPIYSAGPYFGKLTTRRLIRFSAVYGSLTYVRFTGFVDSWPQTAIDPSQHVAETVVTATDLFGWLAKNNLRTVAPAITGDPVFGRVGGPYKTGGQLGFPTDESCGARIDKILDLWPLPPSMRNRHNGLTFLARDFPDPSETALNYLQRINTSEYGRLYVNVRGALTFEQRGSWELITRQRVSQMTITDAPGPSDAPFAAIQVDPADERYIRNRVVRGRDGFQTNFVAQDLQSILTHGQLEDSHTDCLTRYPEDFQNQTTWLLPKYAHPGPRFSSVTLKPQRAPAAIFPAVLDADIGTRVTVEYTQTQVGSPLVADMWIEQLTESYEPKYCEISFSLAPVDTDFY